jgi:hypothetical protein
VTEPEHTASSRYLELSTSGDAAGQNAARLPRSIPLQDLRDLGHPESPIYSLDKDSGGARRRRRRENSGETLREGSEVVAKKVQDNPLGALLIAAGIGFALAMLMTRPPRRPPQRWR